MGNNLIVSATIVFLALNAGVMFLMVRTMMKVSLETIRSHTNSSNLPKDTVSLRDVQDFINAKAKILYNENDYAINSDCYKIGRDLECNLIISDDSVSRHHCEIDYRNDVFILSDLGATNGTYLNGAQIFNSMELKDGDKIRLGRITVKFERHTASTTMTMFDLEPFSDSEKGRGTNNDAGEQP